MERRNSNPETQQEQTRALSPQEIMELKQDLLPPEVFEAVNQLLAKNVSQYGYAHIKQDVVVQVLEELGLERADIFKNHWLDFENAYREAGWEVVYDQPGFNETYEAYFKFSIPRQHSLGVTATQQFWPGS